MWLRNDRAIIRCRGCPVNAQNGDDVSVAEDRAREDTQLIRSRLARDLRFEAIDQGIELPAVMLMTTPPVASLAHSSKGNAEYLQVAGLDLAL